MPGTPGHPRSYAVNVHTVVDLVTGLEWQRVIEPTLRTWTEASNFCNTLSLEGNDDWRLPGRIEALSLLNFDANFWQNDIDPISFPVIPTGNTLWTSSLDSLSTPFSIDENQARLDAYLPDPFPQYGRCVRGSATPPLGGHFTVNGDGTVSDNGTGLVWQRNLGQRVRFNAAVSYCSTLTIAGQGGFRLPTITELLTIADESRTHPSRDISIFPLESTIDLNPGSSLWSSSSNANNDIWIMYMDRVAIEPTRLYGPGVDPRSHVRCVR